jgi:hypothetical protein
VYSITGFETQITEKDAGFFGSDIYGCFVSFKSDNDLIHVHKVSFLLVPRSDTTFNDAVSHRRNLCHFDFSLYTNTHTEREERCTVLLQLSDENCVDEENIQIRCLFLCLHLDGPCDEGEAVP